MRLGALGVCVRAVCARRWHPRSHGGGSGSPCAPAQPVCVRCVRASLRAARASAGSEGMHAPFRLTGAPVCETPDAEMTAGVACTSRDVRRVSEQCGCATSASGRPIAPASATAQRYADVCALRRQGRVATVARTVEPVGVRVIRAPPACVCSRAPGASPPPPPPSQGRAGRCVLAVQGGARSRCAAGAWPPPCAPGPSSEPVSAGAHRVA